MTDTKKQIEVNDTFYPFIIVETVTGVGKYGTFRLGKRTCIGKDLINNLIIYKDNDNKFCCIEESSCFTELSGLLKAIESISLPLILLETEHK